jgi:hypothetical protein
MPAPSLTTLQRIPLANELVLQLSDLAGFGGALRPRDDTTVRKYLSGADPGTPAAIWDASALIARALIGVVEEARLDVKCPPEAIVALRVHDRMCHYDALVLPYNISSPGKSLGFISNVAIRALVLPRIVDTVVGFRIITKDASPLPEALPIGDAAVAAPVAELFRRLRIHDASFTWLKLRNAIASGDLPCSCDSRTIERAHEGAIIEADDEAGGVDGLCEVSEHYGLGDDVELLRSMLRRHYALARIGRWASKNDLVDFANEVLLTVRARQEAERDAPPERGWTLLLGKADPEPVEEVLARVLAGPGGASMLIVRRSFIRLLASKESEAWFFMRLGALSVSLLGSGELTRMGAAVGSTLLSLSGAPGLALKLFLVGTKDGPFEQHEQLHLIHLLLKLGEVDPALHIAGPFLDDPKHGRALRGEFARCLLDAGKVDEALAMFAPVRDEDDLTAGECELLADIERAGAPVEARSSTKRFKEEARRGYRFRWETTSRKPKR